MGRNVWGEGVGPRRGCGEGRYMENHAESKLIGAPCAYVEFGEGGVGEEMWNLSRNAGKGGT